jgi:hypothetical protein
MERKEGGSLLLGADFIVFVQSLLSQLSHIILSRIVSKDVRVSACVLDRNSTQTNSKHTRGWNHHLGPGLWWSFDDWKLFYFRLDDF